ncbi:hypothetical protein QR685DRAFT_50514 [Neurospora intermedia]|uniref:Uncharacterized protein n=1 Tax=Neurospora intermedia TaxID=5142 RepID=A0ABR3DS27_NEUIN
MASHAPSHLSAESKSSIIRSLLSLFGAGPAHQKSESATVGKDDEAVLGRLPLFPAADFFKNISAVGRTVWAFTKDDIFTATLPNAIFAITAAIADTYLRGEAFEGAGPTFPEITTRLPLTYFFNFYALLIFNLGNQQPQEGSSGKPVKTPEQIRRIYLTLLPIALALNHFLGVWHEGLMIHLLAFIYNDLSRGNELFVRDIILGISFGYINSASLKIVLMAGSSSSPHRHTWTWLNLVSVLIATTIGCQEFKNHRDHHRTPGNQEGGSSGNKTMKRKKTLAIFLGEAAVPRAQLAMMMPVWTLVCAWFWQLKITVAAYFVLYSLFLACRVLTQRSAGAEERTWRLWARWTIVIYLIPLVAALSTA